MRRQRSPRSLRWMASRAPRSDEDLDLMTQRV
jgi:hypothetical protein